jgi:hypothetical protein
LVKSDVFCEGEFFCKVEREIWADTANAAKVEFEKANKGSGFNVKNLKVKEIKNER